MWSSRIMRKIEHLSGAHANQAMRHVIGRIGLLFLVALPAACAAGGPPESGEPAPRFDRSTLSREQLNDQHFDNAYEAVQTLRSTWLQTRGPDSFNSPSIVKVYMDANYLGDVSMLRTVPISVIASIHHLDAVEATARYGIGHGGGVVFIATYPISAPRPVAPAVGNR
jgi:hypothetical protein